MNGDRIRLRNENAPERRSHGHGHGHVIYVAHASGRHWTGHRYRMLLCISQNTSGRFQGRAGLALASPRGVCRSSGEFSDGAATRVGESGRDVVFRHDMFNDGIELVVNVGYVESECCRSVWFRRIVSGDWSILVGSYCVLFCSRGLNGFSSVFRWCTELSKLDFVGNHRSFYRAWVLRVEDQRDALRGRFCV